MPNLSTHLSNAYRSLFRKKSAVSGEGSWRGPFSAMGELGSWFQLGSTETGWQRNLDVSRAQIEHFPAVHTCVTIISQEMSRIPVLHYRLEEDGRKTKITNKSPFRIFRNPNPHQTKTDFMMYMMRSMLLDGNAYAYVQYNDRFEPESFWPLNPKHCWPYFIDGEVFYRVGDQNADVMTNLESDSWLPARNIFHIRMHCPKHPLVGESPLVAAAMSATTGMMIGKHSANFFGNMSRPSGVLRFPGSLGPNDQLQETAIRRIKQRFMEITQSNNIGEPLVLQNNAEWQPMTMSAVDAEIIQSYKLSWRDIMNVFRVPPFLAGEQINNLQGVESLSRYFTNSALGWYIQNWEDALTKFFGLPPNEEIVFDVETALLRADMKERAESLAKFIQNGVLSPDEARLREGLPPVENGFGSEPRAQQQLVPLSYASYMIEQAQQAEPAPEPEPEPEPEPDPEAEEAKQLAAAIVARKAIEKAMTNE